MIDSVDLRKQEISTEIELDKLFVIKYAITLFVSAHPEAVNNPKKSLFCGYKHAVFNLTSVSNESETVSLQCCAFAQ